MSTLLDRFESLTNTFAPNNTEATTVVRNFLTFYSDAHDVLASLPAEDRANTPPLLGKADAFDEHGYREALGELIAGHAIVPVSLVNLPVRHPDQGKCSYTLAVLGDVHLMDAFLHYSWPRDHVTEIDVAMQEKYPMGLIVDALELRHSALHDLLYPQTNPPESETSGAPICDTIAGVLDELLRDVLYGLAGKQTITLDPLRALQVAMKWPPVAFDRKRVIVMTH